MILAPRPLREPFGALASDSELARREYGGCQPVARPDDRPQRDLRGSDLETYIRLLQIDGKAAFYPWSIRSFSPKEIDRLLAQPTDHPWAEHYDLGLSSGVRFTFDLVHPSLTTSVNAQDHQLRMKIDDPGVASPA